MQLSELIGKQVININDTKLEGIVTNALCSSKSMSVEYLIITDESTYDKKVIKTKDIHSIKEAVTIKNKSVLHLFDTLELELMGYHNPINSSVFSTDGEYYDTVKDLCLGPKLKIKHFVLKEDTLALQNIACFNSTIVLLYNLNEVHSLAKYRLKQPSVKLLNTNLNNKVETLNNATHSVTLPKKAITNYFFLLNRIVTKDILNPNGDMIVKENTVITPSVVDKVRCYGKLNELTKYSTNN